MESNSNTAFFRKESCMHQGNYISFRRGQLSLIIIMVLVIVGGIVMFFAFRGSFGGENIPAEFVPVYNSYSACIEKTLEDALDIAGTQGGRVFVSNSERGSSYSPFSSELNFIGIQVPYWFYMASNGVVKENVPSKLDIEREIGRFVEENANDCDFDKYYNEGFYIELDEPKAQVKISDNSVEVKVRAPLILARGENSAIRVNHDIEISTRFGKLYTQAVELYEFQRDGMFLENYSIDVLRLYAPVDGVEISCSPQIWKTREVVEELQQGLEANIGALKVKGNYYDLGDKKDEYFVINKKSDFPVRFIYSPQWPTRIEVTPSDQELLIAEPIGNNEGFGSLGFCYVPYHFVWDVRYPVMIQLGDGIEELFQFPVVVIVDNNVAREANLGELGDLFGVQEDFDVCAFKENDVDVRVFDSNLNAVKANISYQCFSQVCDLGESESVGLDEVYSGKIPACFNGYLIAESEGYERKKELFSSNDEIARDMILDRVYDVEINVLVDDKILAEGSSAMVHFSGDEGVVSAILPGNNKVKLKEGGYEIQVYVYGSASIILPSSKKTQCTETSRGGLLGFLGQTKEQCFEIEIPETKIDQSLVGGGKTTIFLLEDELALGKAEVRVQGLPNPKSIDELQQNFVNFDSLNAGVIFE